MGLFEQRVSEEQVRAARRRIESGELSLRAAAAEIGCAPSTLSVRIKRARLADDDVLARAGLGADGTRLSQRRAAKRDASGRAGEAAMAAAGPEPIALLREAMEASKPNGLPDWPTRMSAMRLLAALRPEELEPEQEPDEEPAMTTVYDLPPGSAPILHRPPHGDKTPPADSTALPEPGTHVLLRDGAAIWLVDHGPGGGHPHVTESIEEAAEILRAFGGDPACLTPRAENPETDTDAQPDTA